MAGFARIALGFYPKDGRRMGSLVTFARWPESVACTRFADVRLHQGPDGEQIG
jgi:hypothetical protein